MNYYAFTGDVKLLKTLDYKFQKLYARNYKTYKKNDIIMYVISKMAIEIDNVDDEFQTTIISFILNNKNQPKEFWAEDRVIELKITIPYPNAPLYYMSKLGNIYSDIEWQEGHSDYIQSFTAIANKHRDEITNKQTDKGGELLRELNSKNEFSERAFKFELDFVKDIIALDNLHPLEIIELEAA